MKAKWLSRLLCRAINPEKVEATRAPDVVIDGGGPTTPVYLKRWWIIPRNPVFNIYLHKFCASDPADEFHDHPWGNLSLILRGGYIEETLTTIGGLEAVEVDLRNEGDVVFRRPVKAHRIELHPAEPDIADEIGAADHPCWTLFLTGPRFRMWGFKDAATGEWTPWESADVRGAK